MDIVIRSYYKDFRWLSYCLRSIRKFCHGFSNVIVIIPQSSAERFRWLGLGAGVTTVVCEDYYDDYLGQQVTKLMADSYSEADFICHLDADCVFRRAIRPPDLFVNGKPTFVITPYRVLPNSLPWQRLSEGFLGREVEFDFMRRQPLVFPRWLYRDLRQFGRRAFGITLGDYVMSRPSAGFSEYNALGAYAYYHHADAFKWVVRSVPEPEEEFCRWFWSWGGVTPKVGAEMTSILD